MRDGDDQLRGSDCCCHPPGPRLRGRLSSHAAGSFPRELHRRQADAGTRPGLHHRLRRQPPRMWSPRRAPRALPPSLRGSRASRHGPAGPPGRHGVAGRRPPSGALGQTRRLGEEPVEPVVGCQQRPECADLPPHGHNFALRRCRWVVGERFFRRAMDSGSAQGEQSGNRLIAFGSNDGVATGAIEGQFSLGAASGKKELKVPRGDAHVCTPGALQRKSHLSSSVVSKFFGRGTLMA